MPPFGNISNPRVLSDMGLAIFSTTGFEDYLKAQKKSNVRQILSYVQRYHHVLDTGDASAIVGLSSSATRRHAMEGLAAYSKYVGKYNVWKDICTRYQLRWGNSEEDNLRYFTNYLHGHGNFDQMMAWLLDALRILPSQAGNVLLYNTLTGLRPSEAILSIKLIKTDPDRYINKETGMLENFRYPNLFIRKTKKSYLTAYDDSILEVARGAGSYKSWKAIRSLLKRRGMEAVHLKYCGAIFATYLRKYGGLEQEVIDVY